MVSRSKVWILSLAMLLLLAARPSLAADGVQGHLATVGWLQTNLSRADLVLIDASPAPLHRKQHIPGAVPSGLFTFGPNDPPLARIEQQLRSWGVSADKTVVIYDEGGTYMATRLFWDLVHRGLPADRLLILDGGLSKWLASGGPVTSEPTTDAMPGTIALTRVDPSVRIRLPEFLAATADPGRNVMLEALEPDYFFGGAAFFNRGGHVPHAKLMPSTDFYNPDKTFKSPQEIRRMLDHLGIRPEQQVLTYCGGGGAAAVPFFVLKYMLGYPDVKLFQESQMGWLQDDRELPMWTYAEPYLVRDAAWLKAWGSPMLKAFGLSQVTIVDIRPAEEFKLGHVPLAINVPAQAFRSHLRTPEGLADLLGQAGVDPSLEAVVVSDGGLNENAALAFLMLNTLGQHKVSLFMDGMDHWVELGFEVAMPAPSDDHAAAGRALPYVAGQPSAVVVSDPAATHGIYPQVFVASGSQVPAIVPPGRVIHLPYAGFVNADGTPRAAKDIWRTLDKAGMPRYAEVVVYADSLGEAAVNYVIFRLMGFADVKVWAP
ncbi:MAG: rhodanese-like domain-containing protein, partial [Rubrivivax sp.]|nr:rhodanese-like domain-containing protein [Rubrivivax sp.]